jgi:phage baseplate assembly protein W
MRMVEGRPALMDALRNRLSTSRGGLWYAPNYGTNLCDFVNAAFTAYAIEQAAETECLKDERVESVSATAVQVGRKRVALTLRIVDGQGPFEMVLDVTDVTVAMLVNGGS